MYRLTLESSQKTKSIMSPQILYNGTWQGEVEFVDICIELIAGDHVPNSPNLLGINRIRR